MPAKFIVPALLIGLGEYGGCVAAECLNFFKEENPELRLPVSGVKLQSNGRFEHMGELRQFDFQIEDFPSEGYSAISNKIISDEERITAFIEFHLNELGNQQMSSDLKTRGYQIRSIYQILVFASCSDLVGSSATIPLLRFFGFLQKYKNIPLEITLYVLLPNLSTESDLERKHVEAARSLAFLKELDFELTSAKNFPSDADFHIKLTWLIGSKNLDGHIIKERDEIARVVANVTESVLVYRALSDYSFLYVLAEHIEGCGRFYSSFGSSRIIYPENDVVNLATNYAMADALTHFIESVDLRKFERSTVFADCRKFLIDQKLVALSIQLSIEQSGNQIFKEFVPSISLDEKLLSPEFFLLVEKKFKDYERIADDAASVILPKRSEQFMEMMKQALLLLAKERIDRDYQGLGYCDGFMNTLIGADSEYLTWEALEIASTISAVEEPVREFYKKALGIDRKEAHLHRIEEDIKGKLRLGKELEKRQMSLSQRIMITSNEVDRKKMEIELQHLEDRQNSLPKDIETLEKEFEDLTNQIEALKAQIDDPARRRDLKEEAERKNQTEITNVQEEITQIDNERRSVERDLLELAELKKKVLRRLLVIYPVVTCGIIFLLGFGLQMFNMVNVLDEISWITDHWEYSFLVLLVYGIFSSLYYELRVGKILRMTRRSLHDLIIKKKAGMSRLIEAFKILAHARWNHDLHNQSLKWVKKFREWIDDHSKQLREFKNKLLLLKDKAENDWQAGQIPETLLSRSVITKEDIENYCKKVPIKLRKFFKENRFSTYYESFVHQHHISDFSEQLQNFIQEEYGELRTTGVENFMDERTGPQFGSLLQAKHWITAAYSASAPLVSLTSVERKKLEEKVVVCVRDKDDSVVPEVTHRHCSLTKDNYFSTEDKNFIEINRFLIGFPLFQLGELKSYASIYEQLLKDGHDVHIDLVRYKDHSVFPSLLVGIGENDELLRAIVLGHILGTIKRNADGSLTFGTHILGQNTEDALKFLMSLRRKSAKNTLIQEAKQKMKDFPELCISGLREFLNAEDSGDKNEVIEKKVAKSILQELDPLF